MVITGTRERAVLLFDYSRGRQALLSVAQPALGALLALGTFPSPRIMALGLLAAVSGFFCVFAANDLFDVRADRQAVEAEREATANQPSPGEIASFDVDIVTVRHPLAAGSLPLWAGILWVGGLGFFSLYVASLLSLACAAVFAVCFLLEAVYCGLKRRSWLKTVVAGIMVGLGGLAGWLAVAELSWGAVAFFVLFALWEIAGRNLSNDLADLSSDGPLGITTVATVYGPAVAALGILLGSVAMPAVAALQSGGLVLRLSLAAVSLWAVTLPALRLWRHVGEGEAQLYFNRASLYPPAALGVAILALFAQ